MYFEIDVDIQSQNFYPTSKLFLSNCHLTYSYPHNCKQVFNIAFPGENKFQKLHFGINSNENSFFVTDALKITLGVVLVNIIFKMLSALFHILNKKTQDRMKSNEEKAYKQKVGE